MGAEMMGETGNGVEVTGRQEVEVEAMGGDRKWGRKLQVRQEVGVEVMEKEEVEVEIMKKKKK